jgi:hypothetical protein
LERFGGVRQNPRRVRQIREQTVRLGDVRVRLRGFGVDDTA